MFLSQWENRKEQAAAFGIFTHIIKTPNQTEYIFIPEMKQKIKKCYLMDSKKELKFKQQPNGTFVYLSGIKINAIEP